MSSLIGKIKSFKSDLHKNYDELDALIKENRNHWNSIFNEFGFEFTERFSIMSEFLIDKYNEFLKRENLSEQYISYITLRIVFTYIRLNMGAKADKLMKSVKSVYFPFRFGRIGKVKTVFENNEIIIRASSNLADKKIEYLLSGFNPLKKNSLKPKPVVYLLNGCGPSPFNSKLNEMFLNTGHLKAGENDREYLLTAILHELVHLRLRKIMHRVITNMSRFKFFDEGTAIRESYKDINIADKHIEQDNLKAYILMKYTELTPDNVIDNWSDIFYQSPHLPIYQLAHSFIYYVDNKFARTCYDFLSDWLALENDVSINEYFREIFGISLSEILREWKKKIMALNIVSLKKFKLKIRLLNEEKDYCEYEFKSDRFLWPENNIFVLNAESNIIPVSSRNRYRFQKSGKFRVKTNGYTQLKFIAVSESSVCYGVM